MLILKLDKKRRKENGSLSLPQMGLMQINGYLKSRNLKKEDLKRREHTKQKGGLIQQLKKRSNLSKKKIAILIGVNRETARKVSKEPSP